MGTLIWLASYPKSGNTWMRSFLHNLLRNSDEPADLNSLTEFCRSASSREWFEAVSPAPIESLSPDALVRLYPASQARIAASSRDTVFVKSHNYLGAWGGVPLHNMQLTAGAIYILRNPLDVALSVCHHFGFTPDKAIEFMGWKEARTKLTPRIVPEFYGSWSDNVQSWTGQSSPGLLVLRYEDLLDRPLEHFGKLVRFLGLPENPERLQRAIRNSSFETLKALEAKGGFNEKPERASAFFREGRAQQWRAKLEPQQIRRIIRDHHVQMERFGYIPDDYRDAVPAQTKSSNVLR